MPIDHLGEFLVGLEPLPLQARAPVLEESSRPTLALVVPELAEGLLEQIRRVQPLVRRQQRLQAPASLHREVLPMRQQRVLLALDVAPILAAEAGILGFAYLVERLAQVAHDVELVEQNRRLRRSIVRRVAKRLPHVHHRQADARGFPLAKPVVELPHARFRTVLAAKPDRAFPDQVAHHDAVGVALPDRDLVDADRLGTGSTRLGKLRRHVLLLQRLDRIPVELQFLGNILDRPRAAAPPHVMGKALGIERIVGEERELLALHFAAALALYAPYLELEVNARVAAGEIPRAARAPVVPTPVHPCAAAAGRFFERRTRVMTRAFGSPNTPRTVLCGRNPGKAYASHSRRCRFAELAIGRSSQFRAALETASFPRPKRDLPPQFTHTTS